MHKLSDLTLLYVEDDIALREQFVRILSTKFKEVYEAEDGVQALQKYEALSPDMILVDINIPKVDGLEVVEVIRKDDTHTPIVVLSAYSDQKKLLKAVTLGLSEYLIKPVPHKKLLGVLSDVAFKYKSRIEEKNVISLKNGYLWKGEERILYYNDKVIPLTKRERIFLGFLVEQCNKVTPFESITNFIWQEEEYNVAYSSLSHLLKRLRKKLPEELIENVYGEGYKINSG